MKEQISGWESERQSYEARRELLSLQRERWQRRVKHADELVAAWQGIVDRRRSVEAEQQQREAAGAAARAHPRVQPIANENLELARKRHKFGDSVPMGMVTNCTKSNALNYSMVFWDLVYDEVSKDYPDVKTDMALVDALTMWFVKNPDYFDVIVASNLFGDIITDLGAMLQGGMGFAAGGNLNPEKVYPSLFEPIHGSAPKYAGTHKINPIGAILSARMMLEWLGEKQAASRINRAVSEVLLDGKVRTFDLGGSSTTEEMAQAIAQKIAQ